MPNNIKPQKIRIQHRPRYVKPKHISRRYYKKTNNKLPKKFKKVIFIGSTFLLIVGLCAGFSSYKEYCNSLSWSTNHDGVKMANMPVDALNDTNSQFNAKEHFIYLANKAIDNQGNLHLNHKGLVKLQHALNKIKTAKPIYQAKYNKIEQKYNVRSEINSLFMNHKDLKVSSSPHRVHEVLLDVSPSLNSMYMRNHHDQFLIKELKIVRHLVSDTNKIVYAEKRLSTVLSYRNGHIIPTSNLVPKSYEPYYKLFTHTYYHWAYLDKFYNMQDQIIAVLDKQYQKIQAYRAWQTDLANKEKAYADLAKERKAHKDHYYYEKAKKARERQQKREAREERIEAEREQKREEENAKKQEEHNREEEHKNSSNTNTNSNSSSNNIHRSENNSSHSTSSIPRKSYSNRRNNYTPSTSNSTRTNNYRTYRSNNNSSTRPNYSPARSNNQRSYSSNKTSSNKSSNSGELAVNG